VLSDNLVLGINCYSKAFGLRDALRLAVYPPLRLVLRPFDRCGFPSISPTWLTSLGWSSDPGELITGESPMRKGQSIVELALALPVVLMMLFALFYASVVFVRKQAGDVLASSLCEYNATYFPPASHWSSVVFVNLPPLPPLRIGATGREIGTYTTTDFQEGDSWVDE